MSAFDQALLTDLAERIVATPGEPFCPRRAWWLWKSTLARELAVVLAQTVTVALVVGDDFYRLMPVASTR